MRILTLAILATGLLCSTVISAQDKCPVNFDKVTAADFDLSKLNFDSSYGAIILAEVGRSSFEGNNKGFFALVYKYQRRVKILNAKAFDLATVKIPLYKSSQTDAEEILESLSASTYNLVNGKIEESKLNKDDIFKEVQDKNHVVKKFTMPAVKEGSIIDIGYTIKSDFLFNLQPWSFQGGYPRQWSEYVLNLPEFFEYIFLNKGKHPFHINDKKAKFQGFTVRIPSGDRVYGQDDIISLSSNNTITRWVMKDVPALKEESFTTSMNNHISRIEFQMAGQKFPNMPYRDVMGSWAKAREALLKEPEFGAPLSEENSWADEALKSLNLQNRSDLEKAKTIYYYVQKNYKSMGRRGHELSQSPKQTFSSKKGYVPDINMLLVLLLKKANLTSSPTLVSTTDNGMAVSQYPLLHQYNYLLAMVNDGKESYYLDATRPGLGFNKLPTYAYNGTMVVVDQLVRFERMYPDTLVESKVTSVRLTNDPKEKNKWAGKFSSQLGYYESLDIREEVEEKGKDNFAKKITESYTGEYSADKVELKDIAELEKPITMYYDINIDLPGENTLIYFNPMLKEGIKENYFKSSERKYPVELPFTMDETYTINVSIPEGYVLDEVPKSTRVTLNETDGNFEYIISKDEKTVSLQTRLKINRTFFQDEDYEPLRNFFDYVVKKHAEQIVFKKKS